MKFELTPGQVAAFEAWRVEVQKRGAAKQRSTDPDAPQLSADAPYTGAIGGAFTFSFTPTSVGDVVTVCDSITDETIDISEYDQW